MAPSPRGRSLAHAESGGIEWIVEARGCEAERLRDQSALADLFAAIVRDLALHPVRDPVWHLFPGEGGITGLCLLAESHLTVHTFPEHGSLCLNLFCCRPRRAWDFERQLALHLGATEVDVRRVVRRYLPDPEQAPPAPVR
jgi:S-adenosylmethionine decarboxylase